MNSCCSATPEKIDFQWLQNNRGKLFSTDQLVQERQMMLDNIAVASCEENCWKPERNNIVSRRQWHGSMIQTHTDIHTRSPETLSISIGSSCNMTCSYCCKHYSSAWRHDIVNNGSYLQQDRFSVTAQDYLLLKISQPEHAESNSFQSILEELSRFDQLKTVIISGGEPFLHNGIVDILNAFDHVPDVSIHTGLGVNSTRFASQIGRLKNRENLQVRVSAENCNKFYEFNRYNNTWENFLKNLSALEQGNFKIKFSSVISNLTVFGLLDFVKQFDYDCIYNWCNDPDFLSVNVLDPDSKQLILEQIEMSDLPVKQQLITAIQTPCSHQQRENFSKYILEFARRRKLELDIFPESLLQWLKLEDNQNVV